MACTKQNARKSAGGKAPRMRLATKASFSSLGLTHISHILLAAREAAPTEGVKNITGDKDANDSNWSMECSTFLRV